MYATTQFSFDLGEDLSTLPAAIPARKKKTVVPQASAAVVLQFAFDFEALLASATEDASLDALEALEASDASQSIYEYLIETAHLRKLVAVSLRGANVPDHLRLDAESALYEAWFKYKVKDGMQHNQVCNYAFLVGKSAALQLRRDLSAVVQLSHDTFTKRQGKATTEFMAMSGGAVLMPMDIDEHVDDAEFAVESEFEERYASESELVRRLSVLQLNPLQKEIARLACVEGLTAEEIAESEIVVAGKLRKLNASRVRRVLKDITDELYAYDDAAMQ